MRAAVLVFICLALFAARGIGVHWHGVPGGDHAHAAGEPGHGDGALLIVSHTPGHFAAHAAGDEQDLETEAASQSRRPAPKVLLALLAFVSLICIPALLRVAARPPPRPPRVRTRHYLLPPSHAPPGPA